MDDAQLRALSVRLERRTGHDSVPTIERVYDRADSGAYRCPFPHCPVVRHDSAAMWRHVHFGTKHGRSFGRTFQEVLDAG